nr:hypothetical protein [Tanacetum cinerariifolium]
CNPCARMPTNKIGEFGHVGWGQDHMGRSGRGLGYCSSVCVCAQESWGEGRVVLAGKTGLEGYDTWDGGKGTWGGRAKGFGTVLVCVCTQEKAGEGVVVLAGKGVVGGCGDDGDRVVFVVVGLWWGMIVLRSDGGDNDGYKVVVPAVDGDEGESVAARVIVDPVDRVIRILFGFGRKARWKSFPMAAVVTGGGRLVAGNNGECVCFYILRMN